MYRDMIDQTYIDSQFDKSNSASVGYFKIYPFIEKIKEEYKNAKFSSLILCLNETDLKTGDLKEKQKELYQKM